MSGPIRKQKDLGSRAIFLERIALISGAIVFLGLVIECGPEVVRAKLHHSWPSRDVIGNVIVTVGVAGEVLLSWRVLRATILLDREAEERVANLNAETARLSDGVVKAEERAAEALRAAAEANLARVKVEERVLQLSQGRPFPPELQDDLIELLKPFAGNSVDVFLFDEHSIEASILADRIRCTFAGAEWKQKLWHCTSGRSCTGSLSIALASDLFVRQGPISSLQMLMIDLQHKVHEAGTEMIALATGFDRKKPIQSWEMKEYASWDAEKAAPLRIEVAAMQHVPFGNQISAPVRPGTPPQA